MFRFYF